MWDKQANGNRNVVAVAKLTVITEAFLNANFNISDNKQENNNQFWEAIFLSQSHINQVLDCGTIKSESDGMFIQAYI